ncbi:glycine cleavage system protein GcvH [bacterium]|nr:glycine cleavage system protein GcvH [bacterium]
MSAPEGLKYSKTHEWVAITGDKARVGITDFAVQLLSDLVYVDLPKVGQSITQSQPFGEIESVKHVSDLYAPVAGTVTAVNTELPNQLELLNQSPFEKGWMIEVQLTQPADLSGLLDADAYTAHCATEGH